MKLSDIVIVLEKNVPRFSRPKKHLEQYRTPPEIAVEMALWANRVGCDIVVDLGTGTGMIIYASAMLGLYGIGIEIDYDALQDARASSLYEYLVVDFVQADVNALPLRKPRYKGICVLQNPPFGIVKRRADTLFLKNAMGLNPITIISIHHGGERNAKYIQQFMERYGYKLVAKDYFRFPIPAMYEGHVRRVYYVESALLMFKRV
ncbi:METTL5 family protein [Pyrofollis japonicus]|uniref:METTL5 family protein n=1 Tax=Pyrofollis japonicus TaxID=3060460 RepID=UPI00295AB77C|nr:methyltransferase domain-containing protein [Pyrofollis japonicus]BEP18118.1 METTL5 family protein [Pyrofollis japonicus]